jgi:nucleotide-binding universal stress UspA family protein
MVVGHAEKLISEAVDAAKQAGVTISHSSVEEGRPSNMILDKASRIKADLIVIGRRGIRGLRRFLIGSVSSSVVNEAQCDVLVVK